MLTPSWRTLLTGGTSAHFCEGRTSNVLITGSLRLAESVVSLKVLSSQIKFDPESIYYITVYK